MQYWTLNPPQQWQAGTIGANHTPFYFDCADCGATEPKIAGIISRDGTYTGIGILGDAPPYRPAMFCEPCFTKRTGA